MMSSNLIIDDEETRATLDRINNYEEEEVRSNYTASLYEGVSEGDFSDNDDTHQDVNRLEREYFDTCHRADAGVNDTFAMSGVFIDGKTLSEFEYKHFHEHNVTPDRPCTAFFKSESFIPAKEIFEALKTEGFTSDHVRCLQRKPTGEIYITFKTQETRDAFLKTTKIASPRAPNKFFVPQDSERPLTYLTIYDAPYELPDEAIIHRLSPYCEVMWHRRGKHSGATSAVFNGLRHYRVCLENPIPSYLRFGKFQLRLQYEGQTPTCRRCNRLDHKAADCKNTVCFNCDGLGHEARDCIRPMYCCICKSGQHLARECKFSWLPAAPPRASNRPRSGRRRVENESDRSDRLLATRTSDEELSAAPEEPSADAEISIAPSGSSESAPVDCPDDLQISEGVRLSEASPCLEESQMTPVPGPSPAPEGDFTETLDSAAGLSVPNPSPPLREDPGLEVNEEGFIVEKQSNLPDVDTVPNTRMQPTPQSDGSSWADIVDRASPVVDSPKPKRDPTPRKPGPRRRIVPTPSLIPALMRRRTQPAKVPTSKITPLSRENSVDAEDMDTSTGSRKRKNTIEDGEGGGKLSA